MKSILWLSFIKLKRNSAPYLLMIGLTLMFSFVIGLQTQSSTKEVAVVGEEDKVQPLIEQLSDQSDFSFYIEKEDEAQAALKKGRIGEYIVVSDDVTIITLSEEAELQALIPVVTNAAYQLKVKQQFNELSNDIIGGPLHELEFEQIQLTTTPHNIESSIDFRYQALFGSCLFFIMYTLGYTVKEFLRMKRERIWDRFVFSPLSKTKVYGGFLTFSVIIGLIHMAIVLVVAQTIFGLDFSKTWLAIGITMLLYIIVSVGWLLLLVAFVRTDTQFDLFVSLLAVSMAMLGGAYWPLEIVTSDLLLTISNAVPLTHALESIKAVTMYEQSLQEIVPSLALLTFIGAVIITFGIQFVDKRMK
ncbi:ABC transporter permease [Alkalihalobacterium bogoriense]|uniref:ABC transporter permease n=1 Tax=Alkalihalobacterium bogoriense TaxID=246272 RepID=UPI00047CF4D8|nr:ABC transporter permease [Alkalihalobacterium bogoriense]